MIEAAATGAGLLAKLPLSAAVPAAFISARTYLELGRAQVVAEVDAWRLGARQQHVQRQKLAPRTDLRSRSGAQHPCQHE